MGLYRLRLTTKKWARLSLAALAASGLLVFMSGPVQAAKLQVRKLQLTNSIAAATGVEYDLSFSIATANTLGSIVIEFCSNDPFVGTACASPAGFDATAASLISQSGETGFGIDGSSTANKIVLSRAPAASGTGIVEYDLGNITNPNTVGTFYARLQTFASNDGSGPETDRGGVAVTTVNQLDLSTEVPPYLAFCAGVSISGFDCSTASGAYVSFGDLVSTKTSSGTSQLLAATNAPYGYNVTVGGTTLTSGNDVIPALIATHAAAAGTGQFGLNFRANTSPPVGSNPSGTGAATIASGYNTPNAFKFVGGDTVITSANSTDYQKFTASYIVNIPAGQAGGHYATTVSYICLANF